jgi:amidase
MNQDEYLAQDAVSLADLIRRGQVSASEALEAALVRHGQVDERVNSVSNLFPDIARQATQDGLPDGPLTGVPFLLKDLGAMMSGTVTSSGSRLFKSHRAESDSAIVADYKRAGLNIFGKTNTPEFGLTPVTEPALFGPTRNPWDLTRSSGGSSGGAAAAVASGIVPAAHASDGGGSIRIPASACGLVGLKPSRGRVSFAPLGEGWGGLSTQHCVSWTVRDTAVLLDVVAAPQPGDPYFLPVPQVPFAKQIAAPPKALRVAFSTQALCASALDPDCKAGVLATAKLLESLGHQVEEVTIAYDAQSMTAAGGVCTSSGMAATLDAVASARGRPIDDDEIEPLTRSMYRRARKMTGADFAQAVAAAHAFGRQMGQFHQSYDVLLLATLGTPAIELDVLGGNVASFDGYTEALFNFMPNTQPFNMSGQPAITLPLCRSAGGLPIGMQLVAAIGQDGLLLQLSAQLEAAQPWNQLRPVL